ncbi:hypothetical protein DVH05_017138 [Phytophthora capsici]|nr:hypothetical protein DVH05_017138 [Phytophthora capsici]
MYFSFAIGSSAGAKSVRQLDANSLIRSKSEAHFVYNSAPGVLNFDSVFGSTSCGKSVKCLDVSFRPWWASVSGFEDRSWFSKLRRSNDSCCILNAYCVKSSNCDSGGRKCVVVVAPAVVAPTAVVMTSTTATTCGFCGDSLSCDIMSSRNGWIHDHLHVLDYDTKFVLVLRLDYALEGPAFDRGCVMSCANELLFADDMGFVRWASPSVRPCVVGEAGDSNKVDAGDVEPCREMMRRGAENFVFVCL